jgi:hypothetical protein
MPATRSNSQVCCKFLRTKIDRASLGLTVVIRMRLRYLAHRFARLMMIRFCIVGKESRPYTKTGRAIRCE